MNQLPKQSACFRWQMMGHGFHRLSKWLSSASQGAIISGACQGYAYSPYTYSMGSHLELQFPNHLIDNQRLDHFPHMLLLHHPSSIVFHVCGLRKKQTLSCSVELHLILFNAGLNPDKFYSCGSCTYAVHPVNHSENEIGSLPKIIWLMVTQSSFRISRHIPIYIYIYIYISILKK